MNSWKTQRSLTAAFLIGCATLVAGRVASMAADLSGAYLASIKKIQSHDVTNRVAQLGFSPSNKAGNNKGPTEEEILVYQVRDVVVWNVGRRIEHQAKMSPREYMVASWNAFKEGTRARGFSPFLPGITYNDYLNPVVGNFFLSELLADGRAKVRPLTEAEAGGHGPGIQIAHPRADSFCRVWFAPDKGGMLKRLEWLAKDKDKFQVERELEISAYVEKDKGLWMPSEGRITYVHPAGPEAGTPYLAFKMETTAEAIILNAGNAAELVSESSLPAVNRREGEWACHYAPEVLAALKEADDLWSKAVAGSQWRSLGLIRLVLVLVLILLPVIFIIKSRRSKHARS